MATASTATQLLGLRHAAEQAASRLPPLMLAADRVAFTVAQGVHGRRRVGIGETFWQFRRYAFGDAATRIDWRRSAKSQRLYVREHEWEAAQSVWLWRDHSPSMAYASNRNLPAKEERATVLLLALASLLVRAGEHIGLIDQHRHAAGGQASLDRLLSGLELSARDEPRGLPERIDLPRHAHMVLVGDFLDPLADLEDRLRTYAARGLKGHLLQVLDPAEEDLPFDGRVLFAGNEGEGEVTIGRVDSLREAYYAMFAARADSLTALTRSIGWTYSRHRTDRPPEGALMSVYRLLADQVSRR